MTMPLSSYGVPYIGGKLPLLIVEFTAFKPFFDTIEPVIEELDIERFDPLCKIAP